MPSKKGHPGSLITTMQSEILARANATKELQERVERSRQESPRDGVDQRNDVTDGHAG